MTAQRRVVKTIKSWDFYPAANFIKRMVVDLITKLPLVTIKDSHDDLDKSVIMVLGGRTPDAAWFSKVAQGVDVWAADKGVEVCRSAGVVPDMLIGDCDSASEQSWRWAIDHGAQEARYQSDKDLTDFQLALDIFRKKNTECITRIFLTGAWGGRFDHLWSMIISFLNYSAPHVPFCIADEKEGLVIIDGPGEAEFTFEKKPKALSLISFSRECTGVSISGVRWPLDAVKLEYGFPYAVSNRAEDAKCVHVCCSCGRLGFYWVWSG